MSTGVTQLILEEMSGFAMMAGKWLTRLCTTGTECPDDRPDDSRWAMALLLGLPFLSLLFCIGLWLILRWRIPLSVLGMRRPICTKKYHCYSHVTVICSLSVFYYATVCVHSLFSLYLSGSVFLRVPPFVFVIKVLLCCFPSILFQLQNIFISFSNILPSLSFYFNYLSIYCISVGISV